MLSYGHFYSVPLQSVLGSTNDCNIFPPNLFSAALVVMSRQCYELSSHLFLGFAFLLSFIYFYTALCFLYQKSQKI